MYVAYYWHRTSGLFVTFALWNPGMLRPPCLCFNVGFLAFPWSEKRTNSWHFSDSEGWPEAPRRLVDVVRLGAVLVHEKQKKKKISELLNTSAHSGLHCKSYPHYVILKSLTDTNGHKLKVGQRSAFKFSWFALAVLVIRSLWLVWHVFMILLTTDYLVWQ